jgi:hypothetical protein
MKLAKNSHQIIEEFFQEYFKDSDFKLPDIYFFDGKLSMIVSTILQIQGIAIGKKIFLSPQAVFFGKQSKKSASKGLIIHEITHVLQYRREGFFSFLFKYFYHYWKNLQKKRDWSSISRLEAYLEIPYEIEARKIAKEFNKWYEKSDN